MDAHKWNAWMHEHECSFLQSWEWGEFQRQYGRTIDRIHGKGWAVQLLGYALPAGRLYLFAPYGPVTAHGDYSAELLDKIQAVARKRKAIFLRYEHTDNIFNGRQVKHVHPEYTHVVDVHDPEKMLADMKSKWRYNIRLAERKGVSTRISTSMEDVDAVYSLLENTAKRQGIHIHPKSYYQLMVSELQDNTMTSIYIAELDGKVIAGNIMVAYGSTMTYVHGGTDHEYRAVMAPHLLQWRAMEDAAAAGMKHYDFFGIAPAKELEDNADHPWAGITRFKQGFGGHDVHVSSTYEIPFNRVWYNAYRTLGRAVSSTVRKIRT